MHVEALAMKRRALPEGHSDIAKSLICLAMLYKGQRRFDEAEPMYLESLAMTRRALPEGHPEVATNLNNLAVMYRGQEQYEKAEPLCREALAIRKRALPAGHPSIAGSLWGLASIESSLNELRVKECHVEALPIFEEAHAIWLAAYGPEHAHTRMALDKIEGLRQLVNPKADNA